MIRQIKTIVIIGACMWGCKTGFFHDDGGTARFRMQKLLDNYTYYSNMLVLVDTGFVLNIRKFGNETEYSHYRIYGTYRNDDDSVYFEPRLGKDSLAIDIINEQVDSCTLMQVELEDLSRSRFEGEVLSDEMPFNRIYGQLAYKLDSANWKEIIIDDYTMCFDDGILNGRSLSFRFENSTEWNVPTPHLNKYLYSQDYDVECLRNRKLRFNFILGQNAYVDSLDFKGIIERDGVTLFFPNEVSLGGYYKAAE